MANGAYVKQVEAAATLTAYNQFPAAYDAFVRDYGEIVAVQVAGKYQKAGRVKSSDHNWAALEAMHNYRREYSLRLSDLAGPYSITILGDHPRSELYKHPTFAVGQAVGIRQPRRHTVGIIASIRRIRDKYIFTVQLAHRRREDFWERELHPTRIRPEIAVPMCNCAGCAAVSSH